MHVSARHPVLRYALLFLIVQSHGARRQVNGHTIQPQPSSEVSCNDLFTLERESYHQKRYEGTLTVRSDVTLRDVEIDIRFDREVDLLVNYFGTSSSTNNRGFHITKPDYTLFAHSGLMLKLEVSYSTILQPWPEEVRLNGKIICPLKPISRMTMSHTQTPVYRYPPTSWNLGMTPDPSGGVVLMHPASRDGIGSVYTIQQPTISTRQSTPRNFTDNRENRFNSTCQAMSPNIVISPGRWDGVLTLNTDVTVDRVSIEVVFDGSIYIFGNYFGEVRSDDNVRFLVENDTLILAADSEVRLQFFVKFNENGRIPDVREVNFNGKDICRQRKRRVSAETEAPSNVFGSRPIPVTERQSERQPARQPERQTERQPERQTERQTERSATVTERHTVHQSTTARSESDEEYDESECATVYPSTEVRVQSRIIGGISAKSGEIPWHVAIFHEDQYQCGGSIVSHRSIVTAAHCLTKENTNETLELDALKVYIGIVDISLVDDYFYHTVSDVIVHRDYNSALHTTDIGILKLKRDIIFNSFIKPVCLYGNTTDISAFFSRYGKVAGWGLNRNGVISNVLNYLDMPVVSQKKCSQTNVQYNTVLAYGESFCAGHSDGNSVCNGDSGGGLVFVDDYRYYLRGIASISAQKRNQLMCDPNRYSVFTDVSKFLRWIRQNME